MNKSDLQHHLGKVFIADSYLEQAGLSVWLERQSNLSLIVQGSIPIEGQSIRLLDGSEAKRCLLSVQNAETLAAYLPQLNPQPLGKRKSFGFGDRLGCATPGHISALRNIDSKNSFQPILAQQSVRENTRIGRSPQEVIHAARWGILEMGYQNPWGADADHVKHKDHVTDFAKAGYTFFTIDPSDHVDNQAETDNPQSLQEKVKALPWDTLETSYAQLKKQYLLKPLKLETFSLEFSESDLIKALVKYGRALAHTLELSQHIHSALAKPFDLEMSVDETDTPTSVQEHYFIANELLRRNIPLVSLAPRFIGKFQKAVDYIGHPKHFAASLSQHASIMKHFEAYKLSIHTGSDKFSLYPIITDYCGDSFHVKTAGTSYLEALRVFSRYDPQLFRDILNLSKQAFEKDKKSYALDCQAEKVPAEATLTDQELPLLLEQFDSRQVLHVSFGSAITTYKTRILESLNQYHLAYQETLETHFVKHLQPLLKG
jgi:tagaturonate epimerase